MCGRNDNYLGDFKYRIQTSINYAGTSAIRAGLKHRIEIIVVDWNSDTPLSQELILLPGVAEICSFVEVPPQIAKRYSPNGERFKTETALNAGLRRASGTYAGIMPADILLNQSSLSALVSVLDGTLETPFEAAKTAFYLDRKMIPWQIVERKPTLSEWDRYLTLSSRHLFQDRYHITHCGGYGALLLHKDLWNECQGFADENRGWGASDLDWGLRITQKYPPVSLSAFGIMVFDMAQEPTQMGLRKPAEGIAITNRIDRNTPDWGMPTENLQKTKAKSGAPEIQRSGPMPRPDPNVTGGKLLTYVEQKVRQLPGSTEIKPDSIDALILAAIVWHCSEYSPLRYLELSNRVGNPLWAFAHLCPYGEIHVLENPETFPTHLGLPGYFQALPQTLLYQLGFHGYSNLVTGPIESSLIRLKSSFIGPFQFDIILFRCDAAPLTQCRDWVTQLLGALNQNGILIITAQSLETFNRVTESTKDLLATDFLLQSQTQPFLLVFKS
jgi:hypothetical protein